MVEQKARVAMDLDEGVMEMPEVRKPVQKTKAAPAASSSTTEGELKKFFERLAVDGRIPGETAPKDQRFYSKLIAYGFLYIGEILKQR